jgi:biopolymer transport protein ExbD
VVAASIIALSSCGIIDDWRASQRFEELEAEAELRLREVKLPEAVSKELEPPEPAVRIAITRSAIHVDNLARITAWGGPVKAPEVAGFERLDDIVIAERIPLQQSRFDPSLLRDGADGLLVNPLYEVLKKLVALEKEVAARTAGDSARRLNLFFDRDTPYLTAVRVLYTAGQAEYEKFHAAIAAAGMHRFLEFNQPKMTPQLDRLVPDCKRPRVELIPSGALVRLTPGGLYLHLRDSGNRNHRLVLGADGSCVAAERVDGRLDLAALKKTLDWIPVHATPCYTSVVSADDDTPWRDVIEVLEILQSEGRFEKASLSRLGTEREWDEDCATGIRPNLDDTTSPRHERPQLGER